jgi:NADPH-dependent curcumin reductase CurA
LKKPEEYHRYKNLYRLGLQDAKMEAFFIYDYFEFFSEYENCIADWIRQGKWRPLEYILNGIENLPKALIGLYKGVNSGVMMVKIAD